MSSQRNILLGVGGGIAAYKAAELVRRLRDRGFSVRCALSRSASSFIPPLTLEVLTGQPVYQQEYLTPTGTGEELHITAAEWADALCFAPATAHLMARLSLGLADDFLTTTALAFAGPMILAPAMHQEMWSKQAVQGHVATLKSRRAIFVGPETGPLASGEIGVGRMSDPLTIVEAVYDACSAESGDGGEKPAGKSLAGRTVLISAGPTREPLDPVRYLGNRSSGKMGFALAAAAAARGAEVFLIAGPVALETPPGVERTNVTTALEMQGELARRAGAADLIVMTAAVADFRPKAVASQKIKKGEGVPRVELIPNPDLLLGLAEQAPEALRVGFAAETEKIEAHARAKLERKRAHMIVANDVGRGDIGFRSDDNEVTLYRMDGPPVFLPRRPKREIADHLMDLFAEELQHRELQATDADT